MDLERAAERFDALYSEMTVLQRRLIAATRADDDGAAVQELIERAEVIVRAVQIAQQTLDIGRDYDRIEAQAFAVRVLQAPVDDLRLYGAMAAMKRRHAYELLTAALRVSAEEMPDGLADRPLAQLLAAPKSLGESTARQLMQLWGLHAAITVGELDRSELARVCARIDEAAVELPDGIRRNTQRPAAPADGRGAGKRVLETWVDVTGAPSDGIRPVAVAAAQRPGWPEDAVPVGLILGQLALGEVVPALAPPWPQIAAIDDPDEQIRAVRSEWPRWFNDEADETTQLAGLALYASADILTARKHLLAMNGAWDRRKGGNTAMGHARKIARSCGELLSCLEPDTAEILLAQLPALGDGAHPVER